MTRVIVAAVLMVLPLSARAQYVAPPVQWNDMRIQPIPLPPTQLPAQPPSVHCNTYYTAGGAMTTCN